jgi:hypothetical protein
MISAELKQVQELCQRLGAPPAQAETMARQLLKRADQLAAERKITREQALTHLLQVLVHGRQGGLPPDPLPPPAASH